MPLTPTTPNTCDASFRTQHVELLADNERMRARLDALDSSGSQYSVFRWWCL